MATKDEIIQALNEGNYTVSYDAPENIGVRTLPDESEVYVVYDNDGPCSSTDFGGCTVTVCGLEFYFDWESGEMSVEDFEPEDDDDLEEIEDAMSDRDDILTGSYTDTDDQIYAYEKATGKKVDDYYWWEEAPRGMDDDFNPIEKSSFPIITYQGVDYYLMHDIDRWEHEVPVIKVGTKPDSDGLYECQSLLLRWRDPNDEEEMENIEWDDNAPGGTYDDEEYIFVGVEEGFESYDGFERDLADF